MPDRRRVVRLAILGGAVSVAAAAGWAMPWAAPWRPRGTAPSPVFPPATAKITQQTLIQETRISGKLGYGKQLGIGSKAIGTVTWLPSPGDQIKMGEVLLRADERPVILFYGPLPMFRPLSLGTKGKDVKQFERNLADLKFRGFTVDEEFSESTFTAVKRWQKSLGVEETGLVNPAEVIYAGGVIRVAEVTARLGAPAAGDLFTYTGTTKLVTMDLPIGESTWAAKGTKVTVVLPGGKELAGEIDTIGTEATGNDTGAPGVGGATVEVTVAVADQQAIGDLDKSPVDVRYVVQRRENVLTVPVAAMLALVEGGYGLEVIDGSSRRIVAVQTGMAAGGRIEVRGAGLAEGMTVGLPG